MQFKEDIRLHLDGPVIGLDEHVLNLTKLGPVLVELETFVRRCHTIVLTSSSIDVSRVPKASREIEIILRKQLEGSIIAQMEIVGSRQSEFDYGRQRETVNLAVNALRRNAPVARAFRESVRRSGATARATFRVGESSYEDVVLEPHDTPKEPLAQLKPRSGIVEGKICAIHFDPPGFSVRSVSTKDMKIECSETMLQEAIAHPMAEVRAWFKVSDGGLKTAIRTQFLPDTEQPSMKQVAASVATRWERALQLLGQ